MRVAFYQAKGGVIACEARVKCMEEQVRQAADQGAQLIVFPECYADSYPPGSWPDGTAGDTAAAIAHIEAGCARAADTLARVRQLASQHGIAILYGHVERASSGVPSAPFANAATLIEASSGQRLLTYHKLHTGTWHPEFSFSCGRELPPVIELHGMRVAVIICYDAYFPETFRHLKRCGAQLVIVIWACSTPGCVQSMSLSRALENEVAVLSVDYAAPLEGGSCYVDAFGAVHAVLDKETVALQLVTVEVHDVRAGRTFDPVGDLSPLLVVPRPPIDAQGKQ